LTTPLRSWEDLGAPSFGGPATYRKQFTAPAAPSGKRVFLEIADVRDYARIKLNGKELGASAWQPYRWDVTSALKTGANDLEIEVQATSSGRGGPVAPPQPAAAGGRGGQPIPPAGEVAPPRLGTARSQPAPLRRPLPAPAEGSRRRTARFRPAGPGSPGGALNQVPHVQQCGRLSFRNVFWALPDLTAPTSQL